MQVHETNDGSELWNRNKRARLDCSSQHLDFEMCYSLIGIANSYTPNGADDVSQGSTTNVSDDRDILVCNEVLLSCEKLYSENLYWAYSTPTLTKGGSLPTQSFPRRILKHRTELMIITCNVCKSTENIRYHEDHNTRLCKECHDKLHKEIRKLKNVVRNKRKVC